MSEKKKCGWAALSKEKHREFSSRGGKVARDLGVAHRWTAEEARVAARLGGLKTQENRRKKKEEERILNLPSNEFIVNTNDILI
jgi:hypothetical protein